MTRRLLAAAAIAVIALAVPLAAQNAADAGIASHGFVIGVMMKNGKAEPATFASGFFIGDRHIITQLNKCCAPPQGVELKGYVVASGGQNSVAELIWTSKEKLAAVFELKKAIGTPATLAPLKMIQQNQPVFGFGLKDGKPIPVEGSVIGVVNMQGTSTKLIQVKVPAETHQGSSLFDACGSVAGVILGANQSGDVLALPIDELIDAINATKVSPQVAGSACGASNSGGTTPPSHPPAGGGPGPGQKDPPQRDAPAPEKKGPLADDTKLKYTLIIIGVLLVIAFAASRGRQEVAKVMTSRRMPAMQNPPPYVPQMIQQPGVAGPGQMYPGPMQPPPMHPGPGPMHPGVPLQHPGQMQQAAYPPGMPPMQQQAAFPPAMPPPIAGTKPRLRGVTGYYAGNTIDLENRPWVLGRDQRVAHLVFPAATDSVSKKHCTISFDPARQVFLLEDNGSTNGTWMSDGEALQAGHPRELRPGDRFYLGDAGNTFEVALD